MLRVLPTIVYFALLVYTLIDCIQTDSVAVRNLDKTMWIFVIILIPLVGPIAWLVAGRPQSGSASSHVAWPSTATAGFPEYERPAPRRQVPDAPLPGDPDPEKEWLLRQWQAQLEERERAQGQGQGQSQEPERRAGEDSAGEPRPA